MRNNQQSKDHSPDVRYSGRGVRWRVFQLFPISVTGRTGSLPSKIEGLMPTEEARWNLCPAPNANASAQFANLSKPRFGMSGMLLAFIHINHAEILLNFLQHFFETNETTPKAQ
jgi:hypothetical protein